MLNDRDQLETGDENMTKREKMKTIVSVVPGVKGGEPCLHGNRIQPINIIMRLKNGWSEKEITEKIYPHLVNKDIKWLVDIYKYLNEE